MGNEVYAVLSTVELLHSFSIIVSTDGKCCSWGCNMTSIIKIWLDVLTISLGVKIVSKQNESVKKTNNLAYYSPFIIESPSSPLPSYWNFNFA